MSLTLHPILPSWAVTLVAVALLALLAQGSVVLVGKKVPGRWVLYLALLRIAAVALFIICLLRPLVSYHTKVQPGTDLLVLFDTSASMVKSGRLERALAAMRKTGLSARLDEQFKVHRFAFDRNARPINSLDAAALEDAGEVTHMAESLRTAWGYYRQSEQASNAGRSRILLVSDGNDQGAQNVTTIARRLGIPVYALAITDPDPQRGPAPESTARPRITIASVQSPRRVLLGSRCRFRATIRREGGAEQKLPLLLDLNEVGGERIVEHKLNFAAGEAERVVSLSHQPASAGAKRYALRVRAADAPAAIDTGDPYELTIHVSGRTNNILVFEDTWRWEFKFLRRIFEHDPSFSFTAFLSRGSGIYMQFAEPDRTVQIAGFPQSRAELDRFDIFVLGDIRPRKWPAALTAAIHQLVVERGKSLIVIAGPNLAHWPGVPQLEALLPVELATESARPVPGPVNVRPTLRAAASPLFHGGEENAIDWSDLPPMDQIYPPLRKRPGATILLEAPDHSNDFGPLIVLAEHTIGRGRVLFLGTDTLWKWQLLPETEEGLDTPYRLFWYQTLRALSPQRWDEGTAALWLRPDRSRYTAGRTVHLRAELESDRTLEQTRVEGTVTRPDGSELALMLSPRPENPTTFSGRFEAALRGHYEIAAAAYSGAKTVAEVQTAIEVEPPPGERSALPIDAELLSRLATITGAHLIDPADTDTWPAADDSLPEPVQQSRSIDLWSSFALLALLVAILGLDWLLRLLRGFV